MSKTISKAVRPTLSKTWLRWAGLLIIVAILLYVYASPYLALKNMQRAAEQNDHAMLSGYMDHPSIRESLKLQINGMMQYKIEQQGLGGLGKLGHIVTEKLAAPMIDRMVRPETMQLIFQGKQLWDQRDNPLHTLGFSNTDSAQSAIANIVTEKDTQSLATVAEQHSRSEMRSLGKSQRISDTEAALIADHNDEVQLKNNNINNSQLSAGYASWDRFVVKIRHPDQSLSNIDVILQRNGLAWKVIEIQLFR